jgi:type II secretory pathway component PulM
LDLKASLKNLSSREKVLLYGAAFLLVIFLIFQLVFAPLIAARREYAEEILVLESRFSELKNIAGRYEAEKEGYDRLKRSLDAKRSLAVLTYLENISQKVGVKENIEYIRPKGSESRNGTNSSQVELKIDAIPIQSLLQFLFEIEENRNGIIVTYLRLKPFFKEKGKVDVLVTITDYSLE